MSAYRMDHGLYTWSPIVERGRLIWPKSTRIAVAFVIDLGHYEADPPSEANDPATHRSPLRIMPPPDYPTVTHREYGHRIGIFRLFEAFDARAIRGTAAVDVLTAQRYPKLVTECTRRGWEVIAHGVGQRRAITAEMSEADERAYLRLAVDTVGSAAGAMPTGWLSVEQSESTRTPALLPDAGLGYVCDWANDDQPYLIGRIDRPLVSLPLAEEISDVNLHWNRRVTMAQWAANVCEAFDTLYREGRDSGRLFMLHLHPWCIGQPFRVKYLHEVLAHIVRRDEVWVTTGGEIALWYRSQVQNHPGVHRSRGVEEGLRDR